MNFLASLIFATLTVFVESSTDKKTLPASGAGCYNKWMKRVNYVCRYPTQRHPCFKDAKSGSDYKETAQKVAKECCSKGCTRDELEDFCCNSRDCLDKCYHQIRHHKPKFQDELNGLLLLMSREAARQKQESLESIE
ncbi:unnamed protein product [Bursaphelenchus xylophilus]|uniref:(pine wood nematode) hypothetical protein n=1 Tax=Bursaphelenchus xylophilus TaxID=6326 RepID=A0A1I7SLW2_BURXY|nr:unnamed protein product [Bursaphelenchus xylophilus]CAG9129882.1 unnamed protein product [Bursaphelenchus xylophilus]